MAYDERTAERVRQVLAAKRKVTERKMLGGLCFIVGGGMCCSVSGKGGLLVRVGAAAFEDALREPYVQPMKMGQRTMSGFVRVAPEGCRTAEKVRKWVLRGVECVENLPPKPVNPARRKTTKR
jgi:hypothetical protein